MISKETEKKISESYNKRKTAGWSDPTVSLRKYARTLPNFKELTLAYGKGYDGGKFLFVTPDGVSTTVSLAKKPHSTVGWWGTYKVTGSYKNGKPRLVRDSDKPVADSLPELKAYLKRASDDIQEGYRQREEARKEKPTAAPAKSAANASFVVGAVYDHKDFYGRVQVVSRTPKTLNVRFLDSSLKREKKCNVMVYNGEEYIYPEGSGYAHAPILRARRDRVNGAASVGRMKEAASSLKKDAEVRNYLNGWNGSKPKFKAKLDSEGRVILSRAVNSDAMPAAKILELVASSRKNPVIHDVQSTAHGCFVDRKDAIAFFERQRKEDIVKSDVNRRDAFTVESIRKAVRKVHTGRTVVTHPKLTGSSEDSNRYEIEMEASNGAFANISLFWSPIGRWVYDANVGVKHTTGLIHKYPNKVLYSYLDLDAYLRETKKELEEAKKQRATLDAAQKKPSRGI